MQNRSQHTGEMSRCKISRKYLNTSNQDDKSYIFGFASEDPPVIFKNYKVL